LCVDNLYTGDKENIKDLLYYENFEFYRHDITFPLYVEVDQIYNLACPASPIQYQKNPVQTLKTCVLGTINMLGIAKRLNIDFLQASTSEIYGDPLEHPQNETYWGNVNPIGPRACYDEGKRCAETICMDYQRQYKTDISIVRIFNTYGPMMGIGDGRVISNFIVQALRNENITVYGSGKQTRSFCYVDDLIRGIVKLMETKNVLHNADYDEVLSYPINLGNPQEITIEELASKVIDLTNSKSKIVYKNLPKDDPTQRLPDIQSANTHLNWFPRVDLEEGLQKTIKYFEDKL
jgi:UDP-glucuronate decarboxylase